MGERMATIEEWASNHDKVCGDRYKLLLKVISTGIGVLIAVAGFGVGALYKNMNDQAERIQAAIVSVKQ